MASAKKIICEAAERLNICYEKKKGFAYGVFRNFMVVIRDDTSNDPSARVYLCACNNGTPIDKNYLRSARMPEKVTAEVEDYQITLKINLAGRKNANADRIIETVTAAVDSLNAMGCVNCDEVGMVGETDVYSFRGRPALLTDVSAEEIKASMGQLAQDYAQKKENLLLGTIGALLGALAGSILILFIARLGRVSVLCCAGMCFATVLGYKKLGKKFTAVSSVICSIISVGMTYLTFRLDVTMDLYKAVQSSALDMSFGDCFLHAREMFELADAISTYNHNFFLMVGAGILGTVVMIVVELEENKRQFEFYKY